MKKFLHHARSKHNLILFILNFLYVFVVGLFSDLINMHYVYYTLISLIILFSIFTISEDTKRFLYIPVIIVILTWVTEILGIAFFSSITGWLSTFFFLVVIALLIRRIAQSKAVGPLELLESINVYLLLGVAASLLFASIFVHDHASYSTSGETLNDMEDFIYYAFVTMTTLGYGDITPVDTLARSLSIFFSVAGQLYLTMIIALLVGKYVSQDTETGDKEKAV